MKRIQTAALLLSVLTAAGTLASCGDPASAPDVTDTEKETTAPVTEAVTEAFDPFESMDFGGAEIRMLVSANDYDGQGSSNYTIKHDEEESADIVRASVYKRNRFTEDLLNVRFSFTDNEDDYTKIQSTLSKSIMAGEDLYDLVIHDLFAMTKLSVKGNFLNIYDGKHFDFTNDYWYWDYMKDTSFGSTEKGYILAGDYFLDILRSAHALYFNKELFSASYDSPDILYEQVRNGKWTQDVFLSYIRDAYHDLNGDGKPDPDDQYGFCYVGKWGSMIPWVVSSDITFLSYDADGAPSFAMNNERSVKLLETLNDIFYSEGAHDYIDVKKNTAAFMSGKAMFGGYQRICSLELFRDMTTEIGVLPYPKMDEQQELYITSTHDTANVGVIPITCGKLDTVSAVLEVLGRETAKTVMPAYYETALKVKYSRDDDSAQMLDIIRYNMRDVFPLAYGAYCGDLPLKNAFSQPLTAKKRDFVSNYEKRVDKAQAKLDELWEAFHSLS